MHCVRHSLCFQVSIYYVKTPAFPIVILYFIRQINLNQIYLVKQECIMQLQHVFLFICKGIAAGKQKAELQYMPQKYSLSSHEIQTGGIFVPQFPEMTAKSTFRKVLCLCWNLLTITYFSSCLVQDEQKLFTGQTSVDAGAGDEK